MVYERNRDGDVRLGYLDPQLVSELQSIVDQWKSQIDYIRKEEEAIRESSSVGNDGQGDPDSPSG